MEPISNVQINGGWRSIVVSACFITLFLFTPIIINERVGFDKVIASITGSYTSESSNPYLEEKTGQVSGISTNDVQTPNQNFITLPILNTRIQVTEQNLIIFSVVTLALIVFVIFYALLSALEHFNNKENQNESHNLLEPYTQELVD